MGITTAYSVLPAYWRGLNGISVISMAVIGHDTEDQPLIEGAELSSRLSKVNRAANDHGICVENLIDQRRKIILPVALTRISTFALAGKAATSAGKVQVVEINILDLGTDRFCTLLCFLEELCCVPVLPRTRVQNNSFHAVFLPVLFICNGVTQLFRLTNCFSVVYRKQPIWRTTTRYDAEIPPSAVLHELPVPHQRLLDHSHV